jgi:hypothetical protein
MPIEQVDCTNGPMRIVYFWNGPWELVGVCWTRNLKTIIEDNGAKFGFEFDHVSWFTFGGRSEKAPRVEVLDGYVHDIKNKAGLLEPLEMNRTHLEKYMSRVVRNGWTEWDTDLFKEVAMLSTRRKNELLDITRIDSESQWDTKVRFSFKKTKDVELCVSEMVRAYRDKHFTDFRSPYDDARPTLQVRKRSTYKQNKDSLPFVFNVGGVKTKVYKDGKVVRTWTDENGVNIKTQT